MQQIMRTVAGFDVFAENPKPAKCDMCLVLHEIFPSYNGTGRDLSCKNEASDGEEPRCGICHDFGIYCTYQGLSNLSACYKDALFGPAYTDIHQFAL